MADDEDAPTLTPEAEKRKAERAIRRRIELALDDLPDEESRQRVLRYVAGEYLSTADGA